MTLALFAWLTAAFAILLLEDRTARRIAMAVAWLSAVAFLVSLGAALVL